MYETLIEELAGGTQYCVFIDDSGSPGLQSVSSNLHPERKSWVAVIVPPSQTPEVLAQFPGAVEELRKATGCTEFHFGDIYQGSGEFKDVEPRIRIALFEFMADIFSTYGFPILVQTLDPVSLANLHSRASFPKRLGEFDFTRPGDTALFLLLVRVKGYLEESRGDKRALARVFVDEGFKTNGTIIEISSFESVFVDGQICFARSSLVLPIQLADFAAFCLNRMQLLAEKERFKACDMKLLDILQNVQLNYINVEHKSIELIPETEG